MNNTPVLLFRRAGLADRDICQHTKNVMGIHH